MLFNAFWKFLRLGNSAWDFFAWGGGGWLIFGPRIFWVLLEPLGMSLGFDFCPPFNHPWHLKSGDPHSLGAKQNYSRGQLLLTFLHQLLKW